MKLIRAAGCSWKLGRQIGGGGFSQVFEAASDGGVACIAEIIPKDLGPPPETLLTRLQNVRHVVPIVGSGETEKHWVLIMPQADHSLRDRLDSSKTLGADNTMQVLRDIVMTLADLSDRIVHRNINPENIFWLNGHWSLTGFATSTYAHETATPSTRKCCFSPDYAAPEQWCLTQVTGATDVYSVGIMTYELLAGTTPFSGSRDELRKAHLCQEPPNLDGIDTWMSALVMQCLRKSPGSRPTILDILSRISRHADSSPESITSESVPVQEANPKQFDVQPEADEINPAQRSGEEHRASLKAGRKQMLDTHSETFRRGIVAHVTDAKEARIGGHGTVSLESESRKMTSISSETLRRVEALVEEIRQRGKLFRGEPKHFPKVSSKLYRHFEPILNLDPKVSPRKLNGDLARFAYTHAGNELQHSKKHTDEIFSWNRRYDQTLGKDDVEIWSMMQHLGASTILIDFSEEATVALFFACSGFLDEDGRVLVLKDDHSCDLIAAELPSNRIKSQRSKFVRSSSGYISEEEYHVIGVPQDLKIPILKWLCRQYPPVSFSTMYEDMPGYVKHSDMYEDALLCYYRDFLAVDRAINSLREMASTGENSDAIVHGRLKSIADSALNIRGLLVKYPWFAWGHWMLGRMLVAQSGLLPLVSAIRDNLYDVDPNGLDIDPDCLGGAIGAYEEALDWSVGHGWSDQRVRIMVDLGQAHRLNGSTEGTKRWFQRARSENPVLADEFIRHLDGVAES